MPPAEVIPTALKYAAAIIAASPDAVQSTKDALVKVQQYPDFDEAYRNHIMGEKSRKVYYGENVQVSVLSL